MASLPSVGCSSSLGLQQTATRMAPLLFLAAGLIVAFRAGIWNLGVDGQFLLGAVAAAAFAPLDGGDLAERGSILMVGFVPCGGGWVRLWSIPARPAEAPTKG